MRRLKLRQQPKLIGVKKKLDRREAVRERKALSAAHLERSIEKELIERLKSKAYGDAPLNVNENVWQAILDRERNGGDSEKLEADLDLLDDETDEEELEDEMEDEWGEREFVSDISGDEDEDSLSDLEGVEDDESEEDSDSEPADQDSEPEETPAASSLGKRKATTKKPLKKRPDKKPKKGPRVEVEYEQEMESVPISKSALASW